MAGIVYVLSNPAMLGFVKIGKTSRDDVRERMDELYVTGVPFPFKCERAIRVDDEDAVEQELHQALDADRPNPRREFFEVELDQVFKLFDVFDSVDVTPGEREVGENVDRESLDAVQRFEGVRRRPHLNYHVMDIPTGAALRAENGEIAEVIGPRKVMFRDEETYLLPATRQLTGKKYHKDFCKFWTYNGESLSEIYTKTYGELEG